MTPSHLIGSTEQKVRRARTRASAAEFYSAGQSLLCSARLALANGDCNSARAYVAVAITYHRYARRGAL